MAEKSSAWNDYHEEWFRSQAAYRASPFRGLNFVLACLLGSIKLFERVRNRV